LRLFLAGFELTPTFRDINKRFSVRYAELLVIIVCDHSDAAGTTSTCASVRAAS